jgi:hypothetical protein
MNKVLKTIQKLPIKIYGRYFKLTQEVEIHPETVIVSPTKLTPSSDLGGRQIGLTISLKKVFFSILTFC